MSAMPLADCLILLAACGSGMMAGLFGAFSTFVMRALERLPAAAGTAAMQSINLVIVRPAFLSVFFGTGIAVVAGAWIGWGVWDGATRWLVVAAAASYVAGCLLVTVIVNVPLNDRLAAVDPSGADGMQLWRRYLVVWTRWNHVRSVATLVSTALLVAAIYLRTP